MVETICNECQTQNPASNVFCVACGHKLKAAEMMVLDVGEVLQEGYRCVADRKFDQATAIAQAVLKKSPQESGAYALMAMVHEEQGDIPDAIRCCEEVVRIRPESKIDAIKLAQLRALKDPPAPPIPNRKLAFIGAVSAGLLAIAVGMAFAWPRAEDKPLADNTNFLENGAKGFEAPDIAASPVQNTNQTQENGTSEQEPKSQPAPRATSGANRAVLPPAAGNDNTGRLPSTSRGPLVVEITPEQLPKPASTTPPKAAQPERPEDTNVIERGPGQINISESRRAPATDAGVSDNTYRIAQDKMKAGDYRGAIRDFQAALAGSSKKALINQLIGRCYTRLGEKATARQHFEAALSMYEAAGSKSAADAVRREIDLLG